MRAYSSNKNNCGISDIIHIVRPDMEV